jgi:hypothetical protein
MTVVKALADEASVVGPVQFGDGRDAGECSRQDGGMHHHHGMVLVVEHLIPNEVDRRSARMDAHLALVTEVEPAHLGHDQYEYVRTPTETIIRNALAAAPSAGTPRIPWHSTIIEPCTTPLIT